MKSSRLLRLAAGLTLFQALGHTIGAVLATPPAGGAEAAVRGAMNGYRFTDLGVERSYLDAYVGSGWTITALLMASAVLMWRLADLVNEAPRAARPMIYALATGFGAMTVVGALYFVVAPIVLAAAITLCLLGAGLLIRGT